MVSLAGGEITLQIANQQVIVSGSFSGLSSPLATDVAGGVHLHLGYAGENGAILQNLVVSADADGLGGTFAAENNTFALTSEIQEAIAERRIYVNIHSADHPGGEIRGQFLRADANSFYSANLFGSNEIPSVVSRGHGSIAIEIKGTTISITGAFADLEGDFDASVMGGAHLHLANAGTNGVIHFPLVATVGADGKSGVFTAANNTMVVNGAQLTPFSSRNLYANIHTTAYPSGEIRGQVVGQPAVVFRARLSGSSQIPVLNLIGDGVVLAEIFSDSSLVVSGSFNRLSDSLATSIAGGIHIHQGLAGKSGSILQGLLAVPNGDYKGGAVQGQDNKYTANAAMVAALLSRAAYVNVHTVDHAGGALRGQLLPESNAFFHGFVSGISSVPSKASTGTGLIMGEWLGDQLTLSGSFAGLGSAINTNIAGGIHLHQGVAGQNGGIIFPLNMTMDGDQLGATLAADSNQFSLTPEQIALVTGRGTYVNVHTLDHPGGEVRAQLLHEATTFYLAPLSGASQSPPVFTDALGAVAIEVSEDRAYLSGSFANLASDYNTGVGSHIHVGFAGQDNDILFPLQPVLAAGNRSGTYAVDDNTFTLSFNQRSDLAARKNYVNVHSMSLPAGEIRGQLLPLATSYFTTSLLAKNELQPITSEGRGVIKMELTGNTLVATGSIRSLAGELAVAMNGGVHVHLAPAGEEGEVVFPLKASQTGNLRGGLFAATDNTFNLTDEQVAALRDEQYYVNVHTSLAPDGELRSQILQEINAYPGAALIQYPPDGETVGIEGETEDAFTVTWAPAADSNYVVYTWQLSPAPDFSTMLLNEYVGPALSFSNTMGTIDALLEVAGVAVGGNLTLYHRVVATDGSLITIGQTATVTLERKVVTGNRDLLPVQSWGLRLKPNVALANTVLRVDIRAARSTAAQLILFDQMGRQLLTQNIQLLAGDNPEDLWLPDLAPGYYFMSLQVQGQLLPAQKLVIAR